MNSIDQRALSAAKALIEQGGGIRKGSSFEAYPEEIASVLRPYMESKEARNVVQDLCDETRVLKEEIQRKDEEIARIREFIEKEIQHDNEDIKAYDGADFACELAKSHRIALQSVLRLLNPPDDGNNMETKK